LSRSRVEKEVAGFLHSRLGELLVAAFVYGSVATGRATAASDIDCFVVMRERLTRRSALPLRGGFAELQRRLGYTPDPEYPLELFTVGECYAATAGAAVARALDRYEQTGVVEPAWRDCDELEIVRALTGPRLSLVGEPVLVRLADRARGAVAAALAARPYLDPGRAAAALNIRVVLGRCR
jgi:predicted nucleotidyltransferase